MAIEHKLFLDLEETIITNWSESVLVNAGAIKEWIDQMFETDRVEVRMFSFAIWNDLDKLHFEMSGMKAMIERALDVVIVEWLSVDEMRKIVEEWSGIQYFDTTDFVSMNGKHGCFEKVCLARETNAECTLIDDVVPDRSIIDRTRNLEIHFVPVQHLTNQELLPVQRVL